MKNAVSQKQSTGKRELIDNELLMVAGSNSDDHPISITQVLCYGCGECVNICPENSIGIVDGVAKIVSGECVRCGACVNVCLVRAISIS